MKRAWIDAAGGVTVFEVNRIAPQRRHRPSQVRKDGLPTLRHIVEIGHQCTDALPAAGDGLAVGGLILGWLSALLWIVGLVVIFMFLGGLAWLATLN